MEKREVEDKLYARRGPLAKSSRPRFEPPASKGREALVETGRTYNVSHMTISRLKAQHEMENGLRPRSSSRFPDGSAAVARPV